MEIGSFLELQLPRGREFYADERNIARLNSGRAAIYHAFRLTGCDAIWLPYYQCDTVREFLTKKNVPIRYYHIDESFNPIDLAPTENEAVLLVNYYGVMSYGRMAALAAPYRHVIFDCSQAFFCAPNPAGFTAYSARKFVGVPDGAYVVGDGAERFCEEYPQGFSSDTSVFLLQRIEYGCEGKTYTSRMVNEHRIDSEDICRMSALTHTILDGTDYAPIREKRRANFAFASKLFGAVNRIDPTRYYDETCVPMVYPLVIEDDGLLPKLLENKHFQGHWWSYLLDELPETCFEAWLSRYIVPITIDQRYGEAELTHLAELIL